MLVLLNEFSIRSSLSLLVTLHALLIERTFPASADLRHALHGLERRGNEVAVVANGHVAAGSERERGVDCELFAVCVTEAVRYFSRVLTGGNFLAYLFVQASFLGFLFILNCKERSVSIFVAMEIWSSGDVRFCGICSCRT